MAKTFADQIADAAERPGPDLAAAALLIARIEYPRLTRASISIASNRWATRPFTMSPAIPATTRRWRRGWMRSTATSSASRVSGNRDQYEDLRNSCLNEVLDRRTGIPITMAVVYIEIARRAA